MFLGQTHETNCRTEFQCLVDTPAHLPSKIYPVVHLSDHLKSLNFLVRELVVHRNERLLDVQMVDFYSFAPVYSICYLVQETDQVGEIPKFLH